MADLSAKQLGLTKSALPRSIIEVIATITKAGFEAYIVGGGVRDNLLGLNPKDFDAVTNAKPQDIKDIFGKRCRIIGRRFQLAHVYSGREMIEVATFRAPPKDNSNTTEGGMITRDNVWGDINQDFSRRDFSINALYYQPLQGVVKDFCAAIDDIENKNLRLLGHAKTRVEEDPVRLLRALRFKAKLGFEFDQDLAEQFNDDNWALLEQVSPHRLYDESQKLFTGGYIVPLLPLLYKYDAMQHLFTYVSDAPSKLVQQIAYNTDKRIASGKSINPAFFYAGLLWNNYLHQLAKNKKRDMPFQEAQRKAATQVINRQRQRTAIPKFAEQFICDIWLLQPRLANPRTKNIIQLFEHPRFRAGFDFLLLREQCGEEDTPLAESTNGMGDWWQTFQTLTEKEQNRAIKKFSTDMRRGGKRKRQQVPALEKASTKDYGKKPPRNAQQIQQDSEEKAQLQLLSLKPSLAKAQKAGSANAQTASKRPSPLFQSDRKDQDSFVYDTGQAEAESVNSSLTNQASNTANIDSLAYEDKTSDEVNAAHLMVNTMNANAEPATNLQETLLENSRVPHQRRRRSE